MNQNTVMLLIKVLASPTTAMTEGQMLGVLELSNIVKNPVALKAIQFAAGQPSSGTQATLSAFVAVFRSLVKISPDSNPADYANLETYLKQIVGTGTDVPLTYGLLLSLLAPLSSASLVPTKPTAPGQPVATAKPRKRKKPEK